MFFRVGASLLTEPMLRSFLLKGAGVRAQELEAGATAAFNTVMPMLIDGSPNKALTDRIETTLVEHIFATHSGVQDQLPVHSEAIGARVEYVNIVLGGFRDDFNPDEYARRVSIGQHLHVLAAEEDLGKFEPKSWHLYTGTAMRRIIASKGFTAQFGVELTCDEARPAPDDMGLLECHQRNRHWLFEASFEGDFSNDPQWLIVDMDSMLDGNQFWLDVSAAR